jgi:phosphatidate phosphatase
MLNTRDRHQSFTEHQSDSSANETTPLRNNNNTNTRNTNGGISASSVEVESSEENSIDSKIIMDNNTKRILIKIVIDLFLLCCVGFPILIYFLVGDPYKRGFFCDDESLMHPFHDSTVRNWMLYIVGLILPIGVMLITEILRWKLDIDTDNKLTLFNRSVPIWVQNAYRYIGIFGFGAACSQLLTDIAKYQIGRLRPHFFSVCQPVMLDGSNCSNPKNLGRYIEDFTCIGESSSARMLKEMRLSFPSGHSSFSFYTMLFCTVYLHKRMTWKASKLLKHALQFVLLAVAWFTCLSRISDYKHHWSDVLAGAILGITVAIVIVNYVSDLCKPPKPSEKLLPTTRYELNSPTRLVFCVLLRRILWLKNKLYFSAE